MVFSSHQTNSYKTNKKNFKFNGFNPSPQLEKTTESFYKLIESRSPSDSKKQAVLTKKGAGFYEARLKVSSASSCSFEIVSTGTNDFNSIDSLQKKFLSKILVWNQNKNPENYSFKK